MECKKQVSVRRQSGGRADVFGSQATDYSDIAHFLGVLVSQSLLTWDTLPVWPGSYLLDFDTRLSGLGGYIK
jgi:hypothetical protein